MKPGAANPWMVRLAMLSVAAAGAVAFGVLVASRQHAASGPFFALTIGALGLAVLRERDLDPVGATVLARRTIACAFTGVLAGSWAGWSRSQFAGMVHWEAVLLIFGVVPVINLGLALAAGRGAQVFWPALVLAFSVAVAYLVRSGRGSGWRFGDLYFMTLGIGTAAAVAALGIHLGRRRWLDALPCPDALAWAFGVSGGMIAGGTLALL